jgi:hypothetical protein
VNRLHVYVREHQAVALGTQAVESPLKPGGREVQQHRNIKMAARRSNDSGG